MFIEIGLFVLGVIMSIIGYFLRKKDEELAHKVDVIFARIDENAKAHHELRLQIAEEHYQKDELDSRFFKLEQAFQRGFDDLGKRFDHMSETFAGFDDLGKRFDHMSETLLKFLTKENNIDRQQ